MKSEKTREPQYQICVELKDRKGLAKLGLMTNLGWHDDPKRLLFTLSRYKFAAKMLSGCKKVLEVGCADAFGTRIVQQEIGEVVAVDFDPVFVEDAISRQDPQWSFKCMAHDMLDGPVEPKDFDGAFSLDVLEHIPTEKETLFLSNIVQSLSENGVLIIGTPSVQSQAYASAPSRDGHVNCKDHKELKALLSRFFNNVFIFSMNDEVVHTGFHPLAHYLLALCCNKKVE